MCYSMIMVKAKRAPKYVVFMKTYRSKRFEAFAFDTRKDAKGFSSNCEKNSCTVQRYELVKSYG